MASINSYLSDKVYYNVDIVSKPADGQFMTDASFNVILNQALIEDVSKFKLLVQKFKIDSAGIPLFHVELQQPQPPVNINENFLTNYKIYLLTNSTMLYSTQLLYSRPFGKPANIIKVDGSNIYYDNRDSLFAVYSYDVFITMINEAISKLYSMASLSTPPPFFVYDHQLEKVCYYFPASDNNSLFFSRNLQNFIGEGFNTTLYYQKPPSITDSVYSITSENNPLIQNIVSINGNNYIQTIQEYKAMSSWSSVSRILFVSNKLPIKREFYPFASNTGILNNNSSSYENLLSMNIICSFLFPSTDAGDYRTNIVYSSPSVDTADLIDMSNSGAIREVDIQVFWSDKYGNIYPVRLGVNKQINIRFAFAKK
jgi:hypothetical protein